MNIILEENNESYDYYNHSEIDSDNETEYILNNETTIEDQSISINIHICDYKNQIIGMNYLSQLNFNIARNFENLYKKKYNKIDKNDLFKKIKYHYILSIAINNNINSLINIAIHFETKEKNYEKAIYYYLLAIEEHDDVDAMFNLADCYQSMYNYDNALKYYFMSIEKKDKESLSRAINICINHNFSEKIIKLIFIAFSNFNYSEIEGYLYNLNKFESLNYLNENINNDEIENKELFMKNIELFKKNSCFLILQNKINLFEKLNHYGECNICFDENKLLIDIICSHCFCVDCYKKIYNKNCPFCRN